MSSIYIYWDESHLWGLLLWRALHSFELPYKLIRGKDIAEGILTKENPATLMVPGGWARRKFENIGPEGAKSIQQYVASGGTYIGFCGGAGLGLTGPYGLGLCPWKRRAFTDRLQHAMSGHMHVRPAANSDLVPSNLPELPLVPVWWPARFEMQHDSDVRVLAAYESPGPDFWVADLPLTSIPRNPLEDLETHYNISIWPHFMEEQPCVIEGDYGKGRYILSYTHLETPASRDANLWLAHILRKLAGIGPQDGVSMTSAWNLESLSRRWPDGSAGDDLAKAKADIESSMREGMDELLFFRRNSWLIGWRRGIPGANLNALYSMISQAQNIAPDSRAIAYWEEQRPAFMEKLDLFRHGLAGYLLAERLAMTVSGTANAIPDEALKEQRMVLFGKRMDYGGLFGELVKVMDELLWLSITGQD